MATGYDPLLDDEAELARTMVASVKQCIAFGKRAGQKVRRIDSGFGCAGAIVPLPRVHLVRYAGCLAPHSQLRGAIIPTPRQQGVDEDDVHTGTPR